LKAVQYINRICKPDRINRPVRATLGGLHDFEDCRRSKAFERFRVVVLLAYLRLMKRKPKVSCTASGIAFKAFREEPIQRKGLITFSITNIISKWV
jgi:hypothetical protein